MQKYYCRRLSIVAVWCLVLCVQLSYEQSPQQLRWPTIPPNILTNQNLSCCQIDQTWLDFFNQKNSTYTLTSRRQNITCFGGRVLFPYGPECADLELSKDMTRSHPIDLGYHLKFMGHRFNKAWVNQHGFISFQESFLGQTLSHEDWPHPMYPYVDDPVFIAPLYAQTDLAGDKLEDVIETKYGRVLYKVIIRKDLPLYYTEEEKFVYQLTMKILDDTQRDIRESVPGGEEFEAKYALLATWKSVAFLGNSLTDITLRPRNTFQAMIISDNYHSYAVFNYEHIEWYAATSQGGNPETGTGGKAAKIGFNRGNGTLWHGHRPFSENAQLMQSLSNFSNVGVPGRFIFRIDEWIQPAGCADIEFDDKKELYIWPRNGNMLGGQEVNITGPCFYENTFFLCKWGDGFDAPLTIGETTFLYHNHSEIRARCVQPTIYFNGRVNLSISLDQGVSFVWKTEYNIVDPLRYPAKVELVNVREWHDSSTPARLVVRWNRFDLSFAESDLVDVELWGYYEDDDGPHWDFLQVIGKKKLNKGSFGFDVAPNRAPNETMARRYKLGAIGISMFDSQYADHDPHFTMSKRIYSALHPLGWWRNDEMKFYYDKHSFLFGNSRGKNWAEDQCRWWHEYRRFEDRNWLDELEVCPPTVFFAIGDAGVWAPDPSCNMYGSEYNELNCLQHPEATHCVVTLRRSESGAGNRCCYDKNGNLMYTNDTKSGSTPDRYHSLGIPPYNEYGKVPGLSHYFHDIVPFYLCCHWSNLCDSYLYLRQTKDAKGYKEPRMAVTYGDPHFITFDGKDYTFNGKGEFTLFRSKKYNFRLQARFEQPPNATFCLYSSKGQINATRITAISAMQDDSDMVEVRQRVSPSQTYNFKCDIVINGKIYYFNFTEEKTQIFKNVFVISPLNDEFQSNITIMFNTSGIGVNVECMEGLMHVRASAPASLFKDTNGLFGYWDNITGNDFTSPDGSSNQLTLKPDLLYQRFGMAWRIRDESESIFHYSGSWSYDTFHDQRPFIREWQRFRPWFTATEIPFPSNVTFTKEEMIEMCEGDEQCLYDTAALGSLEVGKQTRDAHRYYRLVHENMKSVNSCGIYLLKGGIRTLSKGNYLSGSVMRISCDKGYTLFGYPEFFCNWNGTWLPTNGQWIDRFRNWPYCEHYHITAIRWTSVGISIAWTVLLAAAFIYAIFVKKQRDYRLDDPEYPDDDGNVDIDIEKPQDEPYVEEETKHLEQNYYKDGFVPAMKALSNLTKSMHSLNTLADQPEKKPPEPEENPDQSIEDVVNTSDLAKAEKFEKPSIILQIPIKNPQLANVANQSGSRVQTPSPKTINPNQNRPLDNSTPIYPYPNRNSQQQTPPQQQAQPYVNQFNFDETDRPYYGNQQSQQSQRSQQQQPPPILSQPPPQSSSSDSSFMENRGTPAATATADDALDNQQSVESLKQKQATNPYLKRMQQIREQQQRQVEAQLKNQSNNSSFNQNNVVIDSDV